MLSLDQIGHTPVEVVDGIYVKLECSNPAGSVKDRVALFVLREAERRGELRPGDTIVEATSGNTGIALAMVGRELGYRVLLFMPEHMSIERRAYMQAFGADLRLTPREGGFEQPIRLRDEYRGRPGYYVPDQFGNPDNTRCHAEGTGKELIEQLRALGCERLDWFVAGVGTGGTLMGVGRALREVWPDVRLAAVEPEESNVMCGKPPGEHGILGIGDGFIPDLVDMRCVDAVSTVSTTEAHRACEEIRERHGFCVGRSSGANTVAARRLRARGLTVATLWPDCSDRYGSLGLAPPSEEGGSCPRRRDCAQRARELLCGSALGRIESCRP